MKSLVKFINESMPTNKGISVLTRRMINSCKRQFVPDFVQIMELFDDDLDLITSYDKKLENCYGGIEISINSEYIKKFADCLYKFNNNHAVKDSIIHELEKDEYNRLDILFDKDKDGENICYVLDVANNELLDNAALNQFINNDKGLSDESLNIDSYSIRDIIIVYTALLCGVEIEYDKYHHKNFKELINLLKNERIVK